MSRRLFELGRALGLGFVRDRTALFFTPGLLGRAISISGVFGASLTLVEWRTKGLLRRLQLSPLSTAEIALARIAVSLAIALLQTVVFLAVAVGLLGLQLSGSWWMAVPLVVVGTLASLPLGLIVGAVSKTAEAASAIANLITLPMAFLSGALAFAAGLALIASRVVRFGEGRGRARPGSVRAPP